MTSSEFRRSSLCIEHTRFLEQEFNVGVYRIYIYVYIEYFRYLSVLEKMVLQYR